MDGRSVAWISYIPIPGLALLAVALRRDDRLVRYHAWQGSMLLAATFVALVLFGLLALAGDAKAYRSTVGLVSGLILLAAFFQMGWGGISAATGRYVRLRPAWDLVTLIRRS